MRNPLAAKVARSAPLSIEEEDALDALLGDYACHYPPRADIVREGNTPDAVRVVLSGWACRSKTLPGDRRQILALLLPGDLCAGNVLTPLALDHTVRALTPVTVAEISISAFKATIAAHPAVAQALWRELVVDLPRSGSGRSTSAVATRRSGCRISSANCTAGCVQLGLRMTMDALCH